MLALGPVFRHEMLAAGRKRRYFLLATLVGLGMLGLLTIAYQTTAWTDDWEAGLTIAESSRLTSIFYMQFAWATMLGVLAITPAVCAGAIASERERRTIEYLFATDLSNAEIVFDKLFARLLTVAKLVLATLPVLAIFRLLGGVPGELLLLHFAMLASTATIVAALSLTVGVWCDRARDAVPRAMTAVFVWLISFPLLKLIEWQLGFPPYAWAEATRDYVVAPLAAAIGATHPIWMLAVAAGVGGPVVGVDLDRGAIAWMIGSQLVASALLLAMCVAVVRRVHLRSVSSPGAVVKRAKRGSRPTTRSPYDQRPMLWKEMFAASTRKRTRASVQAIGATLVLLAVGGPLATMIYAALFWPNGPSASDYSELATMLASTCGSILLLLTGARASGLVTHERERDTWLSLLTSDLSAAEILRAKAWGNLYAYRWPLLGVTLIPLAGAVLDPGLGLAAVGVLAMLLVVAWATTAIGLAFSLRMKSSIKAVGATIATLLAIALGYPFVAMMFFAFGGGGGDEIMVLVCPPLVPMLLSLPMIFAIGQGDGVFPVVYGAGLLFYAFVGFTVSASNAAVFDRVCGRGVGEWGPQPPTPTALRWPDEGPPRPEAV